MKRILFLWFDLIFMGMLVIGCGNTPTSLPTSTSLVPTIFPSTIATLPSTPIPPTTLSPDQFIEGMSPDWRVAYYDGPTGQLCVTYGSGSHKLCLEDSIPHDSYQ
ncbi:MAG TPA: hypothetical protein VJM08_04110, partial [Anaerolineales bacterium]|nr:hypothetical protein [Anaerolineales bacterium]